MRICIINSFYHPNMIGGAEISVKKLAEGLVKADNEVHIICTGENNKIEEIDGVIVHTLKINNIYQPIEFHRTNKKNSKLSKKVYGIVDYYNIFNTRILLQEIKNIEPEVIHTNNLYGISPIVWKIANRLNIAIVHTLRDYGILFSDKDKFSKLKRNGYKKISEVVKVVTAPSIYTLNEFEKNEYFKNSKAVTVYNAIDYKKEVVNDIVNKKLKQTEKDIIKYVYLGRLVDQKGVEILLEVFSNINNENLRLSIAGDGPLKDMVQEYAKNDKRIEYLGFLDEESVNTLLQNSDILIIPSIWPEPFGRVVVDAYKHGMPVIGTNIGGIPEIVRHKKTGILVQPNCFNELKAAILYFSYDKNIKKMILNCEVELQRFSIVGQVNKFLKLYKEASKINQ